MKLNIKVITRGKVQTIEKLADGSLKVRLKSAPEKGKANEELIESLADYYHVSPSQIKIVKGFNTRNKLIEINGI